MRPSMLGPIPRTARAAAGALTVLATVVLLGVGATLPQASAAELSRDRVTMAVHDDPGCAGRRSSTVTGTFSAEIGGLTGPLVAVVVRDGSGVVTTALAVVDGRGRACTDLPALDAGRYIVTASDRRQQARASVRVLAAPVAPPSPTPVPTPGAPTPTPPTPTPTPTVVPPVPVPSSSRPAVSPQPVPVPSTTRPGAPVAPPSGALAQPPATSDAAALPSTGGGSPGTSASSASAAAAPSGSPSAAPGMATAYADSTGTAPAEDEGPQGWRLLAQVAGVLLAATLIVVLLALVQSRSTGRWDDDR